MLFYAEAMQMFNTKLDYWAYLITRYVKGRDSYMDEHLAKVWVCSQLTNIIRNLSEEQAGIALGYWTYADQYRQSWWNFAA